MNEEGAFPRLLELIQSASRSDENGGASLHRLFMDLMYEMSRIQRIKIQDLGECQQVLSILSYCPFAGLDTQADSIKHALALPEVVLVDDEFVKHLFTITEELSDDANDPYHYPVIRVLVSLLIHAHTYIHNICPDDYRIAGSQ